MAGINFPTIQPIGGHEGIWDAIPQGLQSGIQGYQTGLQAALMRKMMQQKQMLEQSEMDKNNAIANLDRSKNPNNVDENGNPVGMSGGGNQPPDMGGNASGQPGIGGGGAVFKIPSGMSAADFSKLQQQQALAKTKAGLSGGSAGGRSYAAMFNIVADKSTRTRLNSVDPAIASHNALVDLYNAYHSGDKEGMQTAASTLLAQIRTAAADKIVGPYFQNNMPDPSNIPAIYETARKLAGSEQNKLVSGSTASPSDIARVEFAGNYPNLADKAIVAQGKFDNVTRTLIQPAISGLQSTVEGFKKFKNPTIAQQANDYSNYLKDFSNQALGKIHHVTGIAPGTTGAGIVPSPSGNQSAGQVDFSKYGL